MTHPKIEVLEKKTRWGFPWVRCCVCSHEFYHMKDGEPECSWCEKKIRWGFPVEEE